MRTKAELIVLNHTKFGENSIILHTLSKEFGRRGFLVRVSPKTAMALFLPLNILEAEVTENPKSDLWWARNFVSVAPLNGIRGNIHKNTITLFLSEVLFRVVKDQTNEDGLADWLKSQILTLDALGSDFANFHLVFLMRLSRFLGFYPNLDDYQAGDYFDLRESVFCTTPPPHHDFLHPEEADKLQLMMRMDYPTMHLFRLSHHERNRLLEVAITYYRLHLPNFPDMKSLGVLRELF